MERNNFKRSTKVGGEAIPDTRPDGAGSFGGGSVLLRRGIEPGDRRRVQGAAVGVQGSETIPALVHAGPHVRMCPPLGEPRAEKERKNSTEGLPQKRKRSSGVGRRKQEVNVHLTQSSVTQETSG